MESSEVPCGVTASCGSRPLRPPWLTRVHASRECLGGGTDRASRGAGGETVLLCGRFTAEYTWAAPHALYKLSHDLFPTAPSNMQPRYNIAPTQDVDFVANDKGGNLELLRGAGGFAALGEGAAQGDSVQGTDRGR
ncbi:hypothetical protein ABIB57_005246 [Devosia sp. UYZn731]